MNDTDIKRDEAERERIAEEQLPDREKLKDFARRIEAVKVPRLGTAWGNGKCAEMCEHLQIVSDLAFGQDAETQDDPATAGAAETVPLADWLERWEQEYADGQTRISRDEAIRRWEQEQGGQIRC